MIKRYLYCADSAYLPGPDLIARLGKNRTESYLGIEGAGLSSVGIGEYASLELTTAGVKLTEENRVHNFARGSFFIDALEKALNRIQIEDWRAYGWGAFELGSAMCRPDIENRLFSIE